MSIIIDEVEVSKGEKRKGFLKVGEASTHEIKMPYLVINGVREGPVLCVLGGIHPLEYASIEGVQKVGQRISPDQLSGALVVVPVVNTDGFNARAAFNNPVDYQNQNRVFPGEEEGTLSRRVAYSLFEKIVSKADALIDSHGGDLTEDINKFVITPETDDPDLRDKMMEMAMCYDGAYISTSKIHGSTGEALRKCGIPCITPESGTPFPVREEEVMFHYNGVLNVMRYMGMIEGKPERHEVPVNPETIRLFAKHGGIWRPRVKAGQLVKKNQCLGELVDLFGETIQSVMAPDKGQANHIRTAAATYAGDTLLQLIKI